MSEANEHIVMLRRQEFDQFYPKQTAKEFHGSYATIGARGWPILDQRLKARLSERVKPQDIIIHPFGRAHEDLVGLFPQATHCEPFIGYPDHPINAYRCYESQAWRHWHLGRDEANPSFNGNKGLNKMYQAVVPNFFDLEQWSLGSGAGGYALFMGRIDQCKGIGTIADIIKGIHALPEDERAIVMPTKFVFAGQGDFEGLVLKALESLPQDWVAKYVEYRGPVLGRHRDKLVGDALCMLMPTNFIEPFAGSGVEAMICGTPLLSNDFGAFTETNIEGVTGYRCNTLGDWLAALKACRNLWRTRVAGSSRERYSLQACAPQFDAWFKQISDLWREGWYTKKSYRIP